MFHRGQAFELQGAFYACDASRFRPATPHVLRGHMCPPDGTAPPLASGIVFSAEPFGRRSHCFSIAINRTTSLSHLFLEVRIKIFSYFNNSQVSISESLFCKLTCEQRETVFWSKANESLGIGVANLSNQVPLTPIPADAVVRKFDNLSTEQIKKIHICIKIMRDGPLCSLSFFDCQERLSVSRCSSGISIFSCVALCCVRGLLITQC